MKKVPGRKTAYFDRVFLAAAVILIPLLFYTGYQDYFSNPTSINNESVIPLDRDWQYQWVDSDKTGLMHVPGKVEGGSPDRVLSISRKLPGTGIDTGVLFLRTSQQYLEVHFNDIVIYRYGHRNFNVKKQIPGSSWHFIRLPQGFAGGKVEIRLSSPFQQYSGLVNEVKIGTKGALMFDLLYKHSMALLIAGILFLLGIVEIILFLTASKKDADLFNGAYLFGLFSILCSIWIASESKIIQFFISDPSLMFYTACISLLLLPIPLLIFMNRVYKPKDGWLLKLLARLYLVFFIVASLLQLLQIATYMETLVVLHILLGVTMLSTILLSFKELLGGNRSIRLFSIGCLFLAMFSLLDLFRFYLSPLPWAQAQSFTQYGILLFIVISSISLGNSILLVYEKQARAEVYQSLAYTDALTGLKNRTSFEERFQEMDENLNTFSDISIIVFDLNNLKEVNDSMGHREGDWLIVNAARLIENSFGAHEYTYRIGGDEFVILSPNQSETYLMSLLSHFQKELDKFNAGSNIGIGIAWGIAGFRRIEDRDLHSVLVRADKAMYECKKLQKHLPA